jgi:primosomal protein N'
MANDDTQFECTVCQHCLDLLESAGQLLADALCGSRVEVPEDCEQCGKPMPQRAYRVIVNL